MHVLQRLPPCLHCCICCITAADHIMPKYPSLLGTLKACLCLLL